MKINDKLYDELANIKCDVAYFGKLNNVNLQLQKSICLIKAKENEYPNLWNEVKFLLLAFPSTYLVEKDFQSHKETFEREVCNGETAPIHCIENRIINIENALYGRMKIGNCVKMDFGFIGCKKTVTNEVSNFCSGKKVCHLLKVINELKKYQPCSELQSYLIIQYTCLNALTTQDILRHQCKFNLNNDFIHQNQIYINLQNIEKLNNNKNLEKCKSKTNSIDLTFKTGISNVLEIFLIKYGQVFMKSMKEYSNIKYENLIKYKYDYNIPNSNLCNSRAIVVDGNSTYHICFNLDDSKIFKFYSSKSNQIKIKIPSMVNSGIDDNEYYLNRYILVVKERLCNVDKLGKNIILVKKSGTTFAKCMYTDMFGGVKCINNSWKTNVTCDNLADSEFHTNIFTSIFNSSIPKSIIISIIVGSACILASLIFVIGLLLIKRRQIKSCSKMNAFCKIGKPNQYNSRIYHKLKKPKNNTIKKVLGITC
ncbi:hypothetical protein A3Q56_05515, partial [Intoshia linei]